MGKSRLGGNHLLAHNLFFKSRSDFLVSGRGLFWGVRSDEVGCCWEV